MLGDFISLSFQSAKSRKLRSWLTVLGIVIGVAAIIGLITVSQGLESAITDQFNKFGTNRLFVWPKQVAGSFNFGQELTTEDVKVAERMPDFKWVTPYLVENANIEFSKESHFRPVTSNPIDSIEGRWSDIDMDLKQGRLWSPNEKNSAIIGSKTAKDLFNKEIMINNNIIINGQKFKVIGILEEFGDPESDNMIHIPIDVARDLFSKKTQVTFIELVLKNPAEIDRVSKKLSRNLKSSRGNENFEVKTPQQLMEQPGVLLSVTQIIFISIASISLVVGGIGIMNSMFTSVLERKKEIGIMKSIGATNAHIMIIFLAESALFGLVGGIIGIILGSLGAYSVKLVASSFGFELIKISIHPWVVIFGMSFAIVVGMLSGFFPAYRAARLSPVEALKDE